MRQPGRPTRSQPPNSAACQRAIVARSSASAHPSACHAITPCRAEASARAVTQRARHRGYGPLARGPRGKEEGMEGRV